MSEASAQSANFLFEFMTTNWITVTLILIIQLADLRVYSSLQLHHPHLHIMQSTFEIKSQVKLFNVFVYIYTQRLYIRLKTAETRTTYRHIIVLQ